MTSTVDRADQAESQGSHLEFSSNKIRDDLIFPRYLVETCSSRTQDYSVQAEGERLSNTFRTGSHWTLKKLPNHLGPGSIRNERTANRMTNLLGTAMTAGPDGLGMRAFYNAAPSAYFSTHKYITTDYNKNNDLHKALLEDERNLNASFSRKPFKTSTHMRLAPPVPHNFGVKIKDSKTRKENEDSGGSDDNEDSIPEKERTAFLRTAIKRKIMDLKLGKLVRNEYSAQEKEKMLAGHFCHQSGNVSVSGERIHMKKSTSMMKYWSRKLHYDITESWSHLRFKIMLQNVTRNTADFDLSNLSNAQSNGNIFLSPSANDYQESHHHNSTPKQLEEGNEELLIQFETDSQSLPPEGALNRYMSHLATHGAAADYGLQRRCDRWGVLEKGLVRADPPIRSELVVLMRMEEYCVIRTETSCCREGGGEGTVSSAEDAMDVTHDSTADHSKDGISGCRGSSPIRYAANYSLHKEGSSLSTTANVLECNGFVSGESEVPREVSISDTEDKRCLRAILFRSVLMSEDFSTYVSRAVTKAKVDPLLGNFVEPSDLVTGSTSDRLPHSGRSTGMKESARGFISSSRAALSVAAAASIMLGTSIKITCESEDVELPFEREDVENHIKSPSPTTYDFNGRPTVQSFLDTSSTASTRCLSKESMSKQCADKANKRTFSIEVEEGSSASELLESVAKGLGSALQIPSKKQNEEWEAVSASHSIPSTPASKPCADVRRDFKIVTTVTGKWSPIGPSQAPRKGSELRMACTGPGAGAGTAPVSMSVPGPHIRGNTEESTVDPANDEEEEDDDDGDDDVHAVSQSRSTVPELGGERSVAGTPMSVRGLLRKAREFSVTDQGRGYLNSHREKMKVKAVASQAAAEKLKKLDERKTIAKAKRRKLVLLFSVKSNDDVNLLCDRLLSCVVKSAGLLPYHLLEAHRSRQSSYKVGVEAPHVTNKLSEAAKRMAAAEEDEVVLEVRPDGMRECNLLTFSFYAPWVKTIQLNARKKEADDIRLKARAFQKENKREYILWKRRAEQLLFGAQVDPRISSLALQAGGGLEGMKWLLSDIEKETEVVGEEYVDILSQMPVTDRRHQGYGSNSTVHSGPPSGRQSFGNSSPLSDRSERLDSARLLSATQRAFYSSPIASTAASTGVLPAKAVPLRRRSKNSPAATH